MKLPFELQDPRGLWLLGALVPLVVLYILKVRRTRVLVASTWLWASARRDILARSPFQRLRAQLPLLLQALALLLCALALSRPATRHRAILGDHVALVIDTSASMSAVDSKSGKARIDLAREAALDALSALTPGADAMVVEAGRDGRIASPLDRDRRRLEAAVLALSASAVEGDLGAGVSLAVDRLRSTGGERRVLIFTDGALAQPESLRSIGLPYEVFRVGDPADNAAIVRVDVRSGVDPATREEEVQAFALVANYGSRPRDLFVTLRLANVDEPLASRRLLLAPGERSPVVLTFRPTPGDRLKGLLFEISPHDAMASDDVAYARVPAGQKQPVALVGASPSSWLERALRSDPAVELWKGPPGALAGARLPEGTLHAFDGICPAAAPAGDLLVVDPPEGPCLGVVVGRALDQPVITSWAHGDQRLRFLTLDGVHVARARALEVQSAAQTLVRGPTSTLVADISSPGRTGTLVGFALDESDWPLKASFVLFVRNLLEISRAHRAQGAMGAVHTGEPLRVPVPPGVTGAEVASPGDEQPRSVPARDGLAVVSDTRRAGLYLVSWASEGGPRGSALVPVNLTSERESDLRERPLALPDKGAVVTGAAALADAHTEWAFLFAALALLFIALDAFWLTRGPRRPRGAAPAQPAPRPERSAT